jgi:hypothetical protein
MEIMRSRKKKVDWVTRFCAFEDRITEEAQLFAVASKNRQAQTVEGSEHGAILKLKTLIEGGWHLVGFFAVNLCTQVNALGGVHTGAGTPDLHIQRDFCEWPPSVEDQELFAEALSQALRTLSREEAQW